MAKTFIQIAGTLGALHYLKNLCGPETNEFYDAMTELVDLANMHLPQTRDLLYSSFTKTHSTASKKHPHCTENAMKAAITIYGVNTLLLNQLEEDIKKLSGR